MLINYFDRVPPRFVVVAMAQVMASKKDSRSLKRLWEFLLNLGIDSPLFQEVDQIYLNYLRQ